MQSRLSSRVRAVNIWLMAPLLGLAVFLAVFVSVSAPVQAATSSNLNFQARLLGTNGVAVGDGTYNIDFKLYNADSTTGTVGTCSGACLWEETRKNSNSQGVQVINGYFSVNLGSVTAFPSTINWDQPLWLTMNIGGTTTGASVTWDGEMQNAGHSIALTAIPYSFVAGQLAKTSGANRGTLSFNTVANNPAIVLPDASGTVCLQSASTCGFESTTGTDFIQNQTAALQQANFRIQSSAANKVAAEINGASAQTSDLLDINSGTTVLSIGNNGQTVFKAVSGNDSSTFFQVQSSGSATPIFDVDTQNSRVGIGVVPTNGSTLQVLGSISTTNSTDSQKIVINSNHGGAYGIDFYNDAGTKVSYIHSTGSSSGGLAFCANNNTSSCALGQEQFSLDAANGGAAKFRVSSDSTTAFQVQDSTGSQVFAVDTASTSNLITNGSFESNSTGWAAKGAASFTQNSNYQYIGKGSLAITTPAAANTGVSYAYALSSNTEYTLTVYARAASGTNMSTLQIGYSQDGSTDTSCLTGQTVNSNWAQYTCTFDTGTVSGSPYIYVKQTDAVARTFYIDGVQLTQFGILANPSAEQSLSGNWAVKGSSSVAQDSSNFTNGSKSLKVTVSASGGGTKQNITLADSTTYYLSLNIAAVSTASSSYEIGYSSDGSTDNTICSSRSVTIVANGWSTIGCTFITPSSHSGTPYFYIKQNDTNSPGFYVDAVRLTTGAPVLQYTEGRVAVNGIVSSPLTIQNQADSANALQVQNATGMALFSFDTTSGSLNINHSTTAGTILTLNSTQAGDASAYLKAVSNNGTVRAQIDANGVITARSGTSSTVTIGAGNSPTVTLGTNSSITAPAVGQVQINGSGTVSTLMVQGQASQAADFFDLIPNGTSTPLFSVGSNGSTFIQVSGSGSTTAFQVQNASGASIFNVDTVNGIVGTAAKSGASTNSSNLIIQTGNATGSASNSGSLTLDTGTATGTAGTIAIGTTNATGLSLGRAGVTTSNGGGLDVTGSLALKAATSDVTATGLINNLSLPSDASLLRLNGASTQTLSGIAGGRNGYLLTLINVAGQNAVIKNNDTTDSSASNVIITGTGADYNLQTGGGLEIVYDSTANVWRVVGAVAVGITSLGTYSSSNHYSNGAQVSGNTLTLGSADSTNPGLVDTSSQTFAGNKTFTGTLTVAPTTNIGSAVIKQTSAGSPTADIFEVQGTNGTSNFIQVTSTAANQGAVNIQSFGGSNNITLQSGSGTVSLGTSTTLNASGALTVASGGTSDLTLNSLSGTLKLGSNTTNLLFTETGQAFIDAASTQNLNIGTSNDGHLTRIGSTNASATTTIQAGNGISLSGATTVTGNNSFAVNNGTTTLTDNSGVALTVNNSTGANAIAVFQDNGSAVVTVGDNGVVSFKNAGDTANAFQIQNNGSSDLLNVNTADGYVINNGTDTLGNVIQNPGFESSGSGDGTGWYTPGTNQAITNDVTNAHSGNNYLKVTGNSQTHAITTKYFAVQPGDQVYVSAYVKNSAGANGDAGIYIEYSDQNKGNATFTLLDSGLPGTSYTLKSATVTIPAGYYYIRVAASVRATATAGTFYFDDFYMKKVNEAASLLLTSPSAAAFQVQNASAQTVLGVDSSNSRIFSTIPNGASAVGFTFNTPSYTTAGAKLLSLQNNLAEKFSVDKDGNLSSAGGYSAGGDISTTGNLNIGSGKQYQVGGTQISSANLSNDSNLAKLNGTGPQVFSGDNKFTATVLAVNTNSAGFQVQNASNAVFTVDTSGNKVILGAASALTGAIQFQGSGGAGTLTLAGPTTPNAGNYTLSIPAITANANICTDNSICANYASTASVTSGLNGKLNKGAVDTSSHAVTAVEGNFYAFTNTSSNVASGVLKLDNGNNLGNVLTVTGSNDYGAGNAYIVVNNTNSTPTGNMIDLQANSASKFSVDASGNVTAAGNINIASGKFYEIGGTQISTAALSDGSSIAFTTANNSFTGNNTFSSASNSFTGSGSGLTSLNASNVSSGTLNDNRLTTNVALLNRSGQTFTADNTFAPTGNGAGTTIKQTSGAATTGSVLDVQTADGTGHFLQVTNAAANEGNVTLQSVGATRDLTLGSGSGKIVVAAATSTIQNSNTQFNIDVLSGSNSTLFVKNSGAGVASLDVEGSVNVGASGKYTVNGSQISSANLSNDSDIAKRGSSNTFTATNTISVTSSTAFQVQTGGNAAVLIADTSARQIRVMENAGSTNYALIYYDTSTATANYTANSGTVAVGTGAGAITVTAGSGAAVNITANAASTWKTTAGTLSLQSGSGTSDYLILNAGGSGQVQINGSSTIKLGSAASDPTCNNGAVYYNTTSSTFRGCQGGVWATLGTIAPTLQSDYNAFTGGTSSPEIKVGTASTGLDIQDADTSIGGVIFAVRGSNAGGLGASLLNVNTSTNSVQIGSSTTDSSAYILVLDSYNQSADPSGINGAMYYNTSSGKFRCYENSNWHDCSDGFNEISKTSDQSASLSSTTMQNDNALLFAMAANTNYVVDGWIAVDSGGAGVGKYTFTAPAGAIYNVMSTTYATSSSNTVCNVITSATSCQLANVNGNFIEFKAFIRNGSTVGNFQFQFAESTSSGTAGAAPTVKSGSVMSWRTAN